VIRRRALLISTLATAVLGLAACSDDSTTGGTSTTAASDGGGAAAPALDAVTVSKDLDKEPDVEFEAPLSIEQPSAEVIVEGDGDAIKDGDTIIWRPLFYNASSGDLIQSWWQGAPAGMQTITEDAVGATAFEFFTTVKVGSRIAMAGWQQDQSGQMLALVQVADIDRVIDPMRAEGEEQDPSGDFPTVTRADNGEPSLDANFEGDPPTEAVTEVLIQGDGDTTATGDFLSMQYMGWTWDDSQIFDSSWQNGAAFGFTLGAGEVIEGWDDGLEGVAVGSQLMLVLPPSVAYGEEGESESQLAGKTLVFVVVVLDRTPAHSS
jgi:peptidylprolyl isomerase